MHKALALALAAGTAAAAAGAGCKSEAKQPPAQAADPGPVFDPAQPYLTDEKMARFVDSMKADDNPFAVMFRTEAGTMPAPTGELGARMTSFAQTFGLGVDEYFHIWTRIMLAEMAELAEAARSVAVDGAKVLEQRLQRQDIDDAQRRELEELLRRTREKAGQAQLLNPADIEIVRRYKPEIDAALAKWNR